MERTYLIADVPLYRRCSLVPKARARSISTPCLKPPLPAVQSRAMQRALQDTCSWCGVRSLKKKRRKSNVAHNLCSI